MRKTLLFFLVFFNLFATAQKQVQQYERVWGGACGNGLRYVDELENGDYIFSGIWAEGCDTNITGFGQYYLGRMTSGGDIIWNKYLGSYNSADLYSTTHKCHDGTYIISSATLWPENGGGYADARLIHFDSGGTILFDIFLGTGFEDYGIATDETLDSNYVLAGNFSIPNGFTLVPALVKVDREGNTLWIKRQDSLVNYVVSYMKTCSDGGFIMTGKANWQISDDYFIAKFYSDGNLEWIQYPYGLSSTIDHTATGLFAHDDGTVEVSFIVNATTVPYHTTVIKKYTNEGVFVSQRIYEGGMGAYYTDQNDSIILALSNLSYGNNSQSTIIKTTSDSTYKIVALIDFVDEPFAKYFAYATTTHDGGYVAVGSYWPNVNTYGSFYLVKFSPSGAYTLDPFTESISTNPNPSTDGLVTVSFDVIDADIVTLEIYALDGKRIFSEVIPCPQNSHTDQTFDFSDHGAGMYIVSLQKSDVLVRKKIIVAKGR